MREERLDALILRLPENIVYLSGYWPFHGLSYLLYPIEKDPLILCPLEELPFAEKSWVKNIESFELETSREQRNYHSNIVSKLHDYLDGNGDEPVKIGFEESFELVSTVSSRGELYTPNISKEKLLLHQAFPKSTLYDATQLIRNGRAVKSERELEILRFVNRIADRGLETFRNSILEGRTEMDIACQVETSLATETVGKDGVDRILPFAFVMSGPNSAEAYKSFNRSSRRVLRNGDLVMIELNICVEGYWSDTTRTCSVGHPTKEQSRIHDAVVEAQRNAIELSQDGETAAVVNDVAFNLLESRGYSEGVKHRIGHGTGCSLHEPIPNIHHLSQDQMRTGMVHSIEPGIYIAGYGGIRVEDMVITGRYGGESLNKTSKTLH